MLCSWAKLTVPLLYKWALGGVGVALRSSSIPTKGNNNIPCCVALRKTAGIGADLTGENALNEIYLIF